MAIAEISGSPVVTGHASDNTMSITHGLSLQAGDVVVAFIHVNWDGTTITDDNGSYAFSEHVNGVGQATSRVGIFSRVAGSSEPSTYSWTQSAGNNWSIILRVFRGCDTSSPWDVAPSSANSDGASSGTTATAPSITTGYDGSLAIAAVFSDSTGTTYSSPTNGFGAEAEESTYRCHANYTKAVASAGAVGSTSITLSASDDWYALQMALRAAPAGGASKVPVMDNAYRQRRAA